MVIRNGNAWPDPLPPSALHNLWTAPEINTSIDFITACSAWIVETFPGIMQA